MRKQGLTVGVLLVAVLALGTSVGADRIDGSSTSFSRTGDSLTAQQPKSTSPPVKKVKIAGIVYLVINALDALQLIRSKPVKAIFKVISHCKAAGLWGFASAKPVDGGVVAWFPTNPFKCLGVVAAVPAARKLCAQFFKTPDHKFYVLFAGTSAKICANLSTQVPGGWPAQTTKPVDRLPAGSNIVVTCQTWYQGTLYDYVALPIAAANLPASRNADWISDDSVRTGHAELPGVPKCSGFNLSP